VVSALATAAVGLVVAPYLLLDAFVLASFAFLITYYALKNAELPKWVAGREVIARSRIVHYAKIAAIEDTKNLAKLAENPFEQSALAEGSIESIPDSRLGELKKARG
jgi:uncharacterized membrane protein YbhN (UPF0104 family)